MTNSPLHKRAISGVKWMGFSQTVLLVVQLIQMGILARLLSPADFGLMAIVYVVVNIIQGFSDFGLGSYVISKKDLTQAEFSLLSMMGLGAGMLLFGLVFFSADSIAFFYQEPVLSGILKVVSVIFLILPIVTPYQMLLQKKMLFKKYAYCEMAGAVIGLLVSVSLALKGYGVHALVSGYFSLVFLRSVLIFIVKPKGYGYFSHPRFQEMHGLLKYGGWQVAEKLLSLFHIQVDKILLGRYYGSTQLGFFSVAHNLVSRPVMLFNLVVSRVGLPVLSDIQNDVQELKKTYLEILKLTALCCMPIYCGLFVVAHPLLTLWLGKGWELSIDLFKILVLSGISSALGYPIVNLLLAKQKVVFSFWLTAVLFVFKLVAIVIGSHWGIQGIAWGMLLVSMLQFYPLDYFILKKFIQMGFIEFTVSWMPNFLMAIVMLMGGVIVDNYFSIENHILRILILSGICLSLYVIQLMVFQKKYLFNTFRRILN